MKKVYHKQSPDTSLKYVFITLGGTQIHAQSAEQMILLVNEVRITLIFFLNTTL